MFKTMDKKNYECSDAIKIFLYILLVSLSISLFYSGIINIAVDISGMTKEYITNLYWVKILTTIVLSLSYFLLFLIYSYKKKINPLYACNIKAKFSLLPFSVILILVLICALLLSPLVNMFNFGMVKLGYNVNNDLPLPINSGLNIFISILLLAVLPAITEELLYRGIMLNGFLQKLKPFNAIILTSIIFSLMHGSLQQTIYQLVLGFCLGFIMIYTKNIWFPIILHFLNNTIIIILSAFNPIIYLNTNNIYYTNFFQIAFPILMFILGVGLIVVLFYVMHYLATITNNYPKEFTEKTFNIIGKNGDITVSPKAGFLQTFKVLKFDEKTLFTTALVLSIVVWLTSTISGFLG